MRKTGNLFRTVRCGADRAIRVEIHCLVLAFGFEVTKRTERFAPASETRRSADVEIARHVVREFDGFLRMPYHALPLAVCARPLDSPIISY